MKKYLMPVVVFALLGSAVPPLYANDTHHARAEAQKSYALKGDVVAVDKAAGKVKLKHEAVPELDWPAMTMFFAVADKAQLDAVKVGERIECQFVTTHDGAPLITQIKSAK